MKNKLLTICSIICFCLMMFVSTSFAKEINCPGGITANIPDIYQIDEEDEDSIFFISEEEVSMIMLGVVPLEQGETFTDEMKEELKKELCEEKDINIDNERTENIGGKSVYVMTGNMVIENINMKAYLYVFQHKDRIVFSFSACRMEDTDKEVMFREVIKSIK
ncbi:hypothetical protein IJJ97_04450 [bacterium]|nr:hypothetical protein [bacterium]